MNTAYVYKWTHIPTYQWYIGSRTNKNAHPDDGYLCSSKIVKPMILNNPEEWKREILFVGSPFDAYEYESELLDMFDARNDERSFNQHNNDMKYDATGKKYSEEHKNNISNGLKGKKKTEEHIKNMSLSRKGKPNGQKGIIRKPLSEEHKLKISQSGIGTTRPDRSDEYKNKLSLAALKTGKCNHCGYENRKHIISRYHNDNCKHKEIT